MIAIAHEPTFVVALAEDADTTHHVPRAAPCPVLIVRGWGSA